MPLIDITCQPDFCPAEQDGEGIDTQKLILRLGSELPGLCVEDTHKVQLGLDLNTPIEGVQVDFHLFHGRAVNAPDIWLKFQFSEPYPGEERATEVMSVLSSMIFGWFTDCEADIPGIAVDCFWGPTHGFLKFGDIRTDW